MIKFIILPYYKNNMSRPATKGTQGKKGFRSGNVKVKAVTPSSPSITPTVLATPAKLTPVLKPKDTLESLLSKQNISDQQINNLKQISYQNGSVVLTLQDRPLLYEIVALIKKIGFDQAYEYLASQSGSWINKEQIVIMMPTLASDRENALAEAEMYRDKQIVASGVFRCGKCGSNETISSEKQTRSADEPMDIKVTCIHCGNRWVHK